MPTENISDPDSIASAKRAKKFLELLTTQFETKPNRGIVARNFDSHALHGIRNVSSDRPGHCYAELTVSPAISNSLGNLHGGCSATIIDTVGSAALATVSELGGVSVHISADYLSGLPTGGVIAIEATVLNKGSKLATIEVKLRNKETGRLVATGLHTKYIPDWDVPLNFGTPPKLRAKL